MMTLLPAVSWSSNLPGQEDNMPKLFLDASVLACGRSMGARGITAAARNPQFLLPNVHGRMLRR
jgi:hypothetical protein